MAWNDFLYQNTGADDFMRAGRQVGKQGFGALRTGDFYQSLGAGLGEGALTALSVFPPAAGAARATQAAFLAGKTGLPKLASVAKAPVQGAAGSLYNTFIKPVSRFGSTAKNAAATTAKLGLTGLAGLSLFDPGPEETFAPRPGGDPRRGLAASRAKFQENKILREQAAATEAARAAEAARLQSMVANAGRSEYGQATGQAQSQFDISKKAAGKELRNLMMQLGQQYSGGVQDMSMGAAQLGMDTSPGALDVGIDYLGEARNVAELGGREQYADTVAKLTQQLAQQRASASAARQNAQQNAILQAYLAEQGLLG
jgi:hypothetical protein